MTTNEQISLPSSGLAEDALAHFIDKVQEEVDRGAPRLTASEGESLLQRPPEPVGSRHPPQVEHRAGRHGFRE